MSASAYHAIQKSIFQILTSDPTLMAKVVGVFDYTPGNTEFPYITIGEATDTSFTVYGTLGQDLTMAIHVWSRYLGYAELASILDDIMELLGNKIIPLDDGWVASGSWYVGTQTMVESDGITRHAITRYRYLVTRGKDRCFVSPEE
jgi:hypothetical protein